MIHFLTTHRIPHASPKSAPSRCSISHHQQQQWRKPRGSELIKKPAHRTESTSSHFDSREAQPRLPYTYTYIRDDAQFSLQRPGISCGVRRIYKHQTGSLAFSTPEQKGGQERGGGKGARSFIAGRSKISSLPRNFCFTIGQPGGWLIFIGGE